MIFLYFQTILAKVYNNSVNMYNAKDYIIVDVQK